MKQRNIITEYSESGHDKRSQFFFPQENEVLDSYVSYAEDEGDLDLPVEFSEESLDDLDKQIDQMIETLGGEDELPAELPEDLPGGMEVIEFSEELPDGISEGTIVLIPGSDMPLEEEEDEPEEEEEKDWANDREPAAFMDYIMDMYPAQIPRHSGQSIVGAERASNFLNALNKEISEAIRADKQGVLDVDILEDVRVKIMNDLLTLKSLIKKLQKTVKEKHKSASDDNELVKEATTPMVQLIMTPFERAMTGILVNAVVSAGHPFEEVWEFLKKKYDWTDREEISLLQLVQDLGYHVFKDRGTIGESPESDGDKQGVDFIKNYFA